MWKYINWPGQPDGESEMLFNVVTDPFEETNLAKVDQWQGKKRELMERMRVLKAALV